LSFQPPLLPAVNITHRPQVAAGKVDIGGWVDGNGFEFLQRQEKTFLKTIRSAYGAPRGPPSKGTDRLFSRE